MSCAGSGSVCLGVPRAAEKMVEVLVVEKKILGFDFILGMNDISALGGVIIAESGEVQFGVPSVCTAKPEDRREKPEERDGPKLDGTEKPSRVKEFKRGEGSGRENPSDALRRLKAAPKHTG